MSAPTDSNNIGIAKDITSGLTFKSNRLLKIELRKKIIIEGLNS